VCTENTTLIISSGNRNFSAVNFPMLSPLVLLVKVMWKQRTALGSEEGKVTWSGFWEYGAEEASLASRQSQSLYHLPHSCGMCVNNKAQKKLVINQTIFHT